jgi:hypothetical protein
MMPQHLHRPLRIAFYSECAAEFYEMAVDHLLGWELITERQCTLVTIFDVDGGMLRQDLLQSARMMGGDEIPAAWQ